MIKYQSKFDVIRLSAGLYAFNIIFNNIVKPLKTEPPWDKCFC